MNNQHLGSNFDDFLAEEGLLTEVEAVAIKRVIAYQIEQEISKKGWTKTDMAKKMNTSRSSLDRLLDPENSSINLQTIIKATSILGKKLKIELV
ncbi:MAG: Fis family transcriptional regulator [Gloeocapsa sp. DLM2.Bin57]|nr:MAG: Fis family transcriptional regulator [Gloeocapsa sp. DLM2.Bin57]